MTAPLILAPMTEKRIVLDHGDGVSQILGTATEQPPDMITVQGQGWCLVGCRRGRAYHYRPLMSPSEVNQRFHDNQR